MKLFKHDIVDIPKLILDESNHSHVYQTPDGNRFRSVTTMINKTKSEEDKKQLNNWRNRIGNSVADYIMTTAALIGREAHKLNENYINMSVKSCNYSLLSYAHHRNFIQYLNKIGIIYGVEAKLYSNEMALAGTADLIAEYNGKLSIIDYKTKRSSQRIDWMTDYFIQTTAYARMWEEITGQKIEQLVILASSEQNTMQEFIAEPGPFNNLLDQRLSMYE